MAVTRETDFQLRLRFLNPIPAPPYALKLLMPPQPSISRFAAASTVEAVVGESAVGFGVDSEAGMSIDWVSWREMWDFEFGNKPSELMPPNINSRALDAAARSRLCPEDQALVLDFSTMTSASTSASTAAAAAALSTSALPSSIPGGAASSSQPSTLSAAAGNTNSSVSWLRMPQYIDLQTRQRQQAKPSSQSSAAEEFLENERAAASRLPTSRGDQVNAIHEAFDAFPAAENEDLSKLKHPTKPGLTAVQVFDFLPDEESYGSNYILMKFTDNPSALAGAEQQDLIDPLLDRAIIRPVDDNGTQHISLYLQDIDRLADKEEEIAREVEIGQTVEYKHIQDYRWDSVRKQKNHLHFALNGHTALYTDISAHMTLRKERMSQHERDRLDSGIAPFENYWSKVHLTYTELSEEGQRKRRKVVQQKLGLGTPPPDSDVSEDEEEDEGDGESENGDEAGEPAAVHEEDDPNQEATDEHMSQENGVTNAGDEDDTMANGS